MGCLSVMICLPAQSILDTQENGCILKYTVQECKKSEDAPYKKLTTIKVINPDQCLDKETVMLLNCPDQIKNPDAKKLEKCLKGH